MFQDWQPDSGVVTMLYNALQYQKTKLSSVDAAYHGQAVFHALNNAENDEPVTWYSDRSDSEGKVRIVMTWSSNGDICRRMHHYIRNESRERSWGETACMNNTSGRWVFSDK